MSDVLDQTYEQGPAKRPMFLKVLCILTFVSCGLSFISSIYGLLTVKQSEEAMKMVMNIQQNNDMPEIVSSMQEGLSKIMEWTTTSYYLALGNVVICLAGALLMWRLKKPGYFIYIFGQILPFISLVGMYSAVQDIPILGFSMIIGGIFSAIFAIAFIIMYGLNVKHMR
ncbi:MAG: hypothetical protein QE487_13580 [Fluviicola sp.]|nr:hypothetical protein [Fluviicola sp.]